jgi:hypothetical protein
MTSTKSVDTALTQTEVLIYVHSFPIASNLPTVQWVPGVKWPGHETDHLSPSSTKLSMQGAIPSLPHLVKQTDIFIFTLKLKVKW